MVHLVALCNGTAPQWSLQQALQSHSIEQDRQRKEGWVAGERIRIHVYIFSLALITVSRK